MTIYFLEPFSALIRADWQDEFSIETTLFVIKNQIRDVCQLINNLGPLQMQDELSR